MPSDIKVERAPFEVKGAAQIVRHRYLTAQTVQFGLLDAGLLDARRAQLAPTMLRARAGARA
jgi:hypothetical protein